MKAVYIYDGGVSRDLESWDVLRHMDDCQQRYKTVFNVTAINFFTVFLSLAFHTRDAMD